jgi:hypothetical protein
MAFNFMSFLGGAAEQLTDVIETREAERMYEERMVKTEQREESRFAKRQAASAARDRKKAEEEAEKAAQELSLHYTPKQTEYIMSLGRGAITAANARAAFYVENNQQPHLMMNMPAHKDTITAPIPAKAPEAQQTDAMLEQPPAPTLSTFTPMFNPLPKEVQDAKGNFEAEILRLHNITQTGNAKEAQEATRLLEATYAEYDKWSESQKKNTGAGDEVNMFSDESRTRLLDNIVVGTFQGSKLATFDAEGRFESIISGNEADAYHLMDNAIDNMETAFKDNPNNIDPFTIMPRMIDSRRDANNLSIRAYKQGVVNDYVDALKEYREKNNGSKSGFVPSQGSSAAKFIPDPEQTRTYQDIENGFSSGVYRSGMTVQYIDEQGNTKIALVSKYGVIG